MPSLDISRSVIIIAQKYVEREKKVREVCVDNHIKHKHRENCVDVK